MNANVLAGMTLEEREQIERAASPLITAARACVVTNNLEYARAGEQLKAIKAAQKKLAEKKKTVLDPAKAVVKGIMALFSNPETELDEAEGLYKRAMISYDDQQAEIRRREQAKLDAAAAAARALKEEQARKAQQDAQAARAAGNEKKAEKLELKAETLASTAATLVAPQVQREVPKASGISKAEYWSAVVVDIDDLVLAVAADIIRRRGWKPIPAPFDEMTPVPVGALQPNQTLLNQMARSLKKELRYPGVTPVRDSGLRSGSK